MASRVEAAWREGRRRVPCYFFFYYLLVIFFGSFLGVGVGERERSEKSVAGCVHVHDRSYITREGGHVAQARACALQPVSAVRER